MFRKEIDVSIINVHSSNDVRKLLVNVKIDDNIITFINVYATSNENALIALFDRVKPLTTIYYCEGSKKIFIAILKRKMINQIKGFLKQFN